MGHEKLDLEIPESGVVLITGPNGSGKSSFVEAPAVAIHGKTLRGTPPWRGKKAFVEVRASGHVIRRTRKGARNVVDVGGGTSFDTATKAQPWLQAEFGDFEVWRKTHVFSSQDAALFTMSTDAERKRLLEGLLDLGHFDGPHTKCKAELKAARAKEATNGSKAAMLEQRVDQLIEEKKRLGQQLAEVVETIAKAVDTTALEAELVTLRSAQRAASAEVEQVRSNVSTRNAEKDVLNRKLSRLSVDECPTCEQDIGDELRQAVQGDIKRIAGEAKAYASQAKAGYEDCVSRGAEITKEIDQLRDAITTAKAHEDGARRASRLKAQIEGQHKSVTASLRDAVISLEDAQDAHHEAKTEAGILAACERVLGLKGVRAHVLGEALSGVESVANSWLERIAGSHLTLALKPYSEKKAGGTKEAILLDVIGAGGGYGYKASSGGERRRIDVAILLALADIAGAAHGIESGTLFLDEVFDSLDSEGVDAVIDVLHDIAKDRAVVVISHNEEFIARVHPVLHVAL